ncbi:MAG TPA: hypothetical protein VFR58_03760 [Flavisolibacter sp.]|nr:hypothetical protein [Flavisolibacter sp.]
MDALISFAIENKKLLSFSYDGYFRIVEPHCYGITSTGKEAIRAFQADGDSSDGKLGWKIFDLGRTEKLKLLDHTFNSAREGYSKGDKAMKRIFIEL